MPVQGFMPRNRMGDLPEALESAGYRVVGPMLKDGAIVFDGLAGVGDLPTGVAVDSSPGRYRVTVTDSVRCFAWANGPQALKPFLFKPSETIWRAERDATGQLQFVEAPADAEPLAVIGVRACDLAALRLQDQHFLQGEYADPYYAARREAIMLIAVNCTHPADTCFCASTGDGPGVSSGYDLLLDEVEEGFLVQSETDRGGAVAAALKLEDASHRQREEAAEAVRHASEVQTRSIPPGDLYDDFRSNADHPRWQMVAERCLACGNCTQVCPTCFCNREHDQADLDGHGSDHVRQWASCFSEGHSYIAGLLVRKEVRHRYRQWLSHKLGSWHRQYGRSGCVGCGRCIAWCPVGIDICEETGVILEKQDAW